MAALLETAPCCQRLILANSSTVPWIPEAAGRPLVAGPEMGAGGTGRRSDVDLILDPKIASPAMHMWPGKRGGCTQPCASI